MHLVVPTLFALFVALPWAIVAQGTLSDIPRTIPVINRSPYFGVWTTTEDTSVDPTVAGTTPITWSWRALNWTGYVRVDGQVWQWLGNDTGIAPATTTATHLTATRTIFEMDAGPMALTVSFLSPVEPTDLVRQSFPFAYVYVDAKSKDGQGHSVQLYTDVDASFVTTRNISVEWNTTRSSSSIYHDLRRDSSTSIELYDMAENGNLYYAMSQASGITTRTGTFADVRRSFVDTGVLDNSEDTQFRSSQISNHPLVAFAVDLGTIQQTSSTTVWAIGHVRENLLLGYGGRSGIERRMSYFWSQYTTIGEGIDAFLADFSNARTRAEQLDEKLTDEASTISNEYADLVSLSLRQTLGSIEISLPRPGSREGWNTSDVHAHMRDTGVSARGNPVEVMYAAMPALLYLNPSILWYLLRPLLSYQSSERYQNAYAAPDMGDYVSPTGNGTNTKRLGVENSGSMLIMAAAYGLKTKDWVSLNPYARLFKTWADFLVVEALHTRDQMSADGLKSENQSNLALKGILGIYAMAKIREALGPNGEEAHFLERATALAKEWEQLAVGQGDHISSVYGQPATWGLAYNAYAATLIAPDLFSKKIFRDQADFYDKQADTAPPFGMAYDSAEPHIAKSHWTIFSAAASTSGSARDKLIRFVHDRAFRRRTASQFATTYNAETGATQPLGGRGSPAQGAMFALMVRDLSGSGGATSDGAQSSTSTNVGAIAGGIVGGVAVLALMATAAFFWWRRRKANRLFEEKKSFQIDPVTIASFSSPEARTGAFPMVSTAGRTSRSGRSRYSELPSEVVPVPFNPSTAGPPSPDSMEPQHSPVHSKAAAERQRFANEVRRVLAVNNNHSPTASDDAESSAQLSYAPASSAAPSNLQQEVEDLRREVNLLRSQQQQQSVRASLDDQVGLGRVGSPREPPPIYSS